jgi:hypothetical protein
MIDRPLRYKVGAPLDCEPRALLTATVSVEIPGCTDITRCRVQILATVGDRPPVAILSEIPTNPGLSVTGAFPFLAQRVRTLLPPDGPEPLWVEHWPERAVAAVLLERPGPTTDMLVTGPGADCIRTPLPPGALERYLNGG